MSASGTANPIPCPQNVLDLAARFGQHLDSYKRPTYNETQVRREFIDPFFNALGWDIDNKAGHAEAYKDVIHEDAIKVGGSTKAPDYCFRIGGARKFFVEAKKPAVGVKDDPGPAYQLRRYAWSNKLPLSIVTDFEEFAVYDCRIKPKRTDKPSTARVLYVTYDAYADRWDEIASVFAREAILKGSFDKYAESNRRKRGTAEVDTEFLKEIEAWRELLARNIALRNPGLSVRDLNFAVAKTIDRIIFLRMCEDRGVETYEQLRVLPNGPRVYPRLVELFYRADERYNSGLFHFEPEKGRPEAPDELTPKLTVDDKVLKDIIGRLYYPECPYEFSVLPVEILGQVYEQFLGKVIRLTKGHRAVVEEKPEVKKAGGVYYTPSYIVDYIVEHTVGKLVEEAGTPKKVSKLRILDPACGSGSFLLGAYQYLLDWHLRWYTENNPEKWAKRKNAPIYQSPRRDPTAKGPTWRLSVPERKRILLDNVHGVDIDPQAVEVTKLSLLLRVLEGESRETLDNQLKLFHERALPDLAANIKCGNSLIGPDFYDNQQMTFLDEEERYRINAFDWEAEFPQVFGPSCARDPSRARQEAVNHTRASDPSPDRKGGENHTRASDPSPDRKGGDKLTKSSARHPLPHGRGSEHPGGFDAVIGNPPYVRQESLKALKGYFKSRYAVFDSAADLYVYFMARAIELLRSGGYHAYIVSRGFFRAAFGAALRRFIQEHASVRQIVDFGGLPVFAGAKDTYVAIPVVVKTSEQGTTSICNVRSLANLNLDTEVSEMEYLIPARQLDALGWSTERTEILDVFRKLTRRGTRLGSVVHGSVLRGLITGLNEAFDITQETTQEFATAHPEAGTLLRRFLGGQDIRRYHVRPVDRFLIAIPCGWTASAMEKAGNDAGHDEGPAWRWFSDTFPMIAEHLAPFAARARKRQDKGEFWWELRPCDYYDILQGPKIIYPDIAKAPRFHLDDDQTYIRNTAYCLASADRYLLGLLNSRLMWFAIARISTPFGTRAGEYRYRLFTQYVCQLPIRTIDAASKSDKAKHDHMVTLVQQMLDLHKQLDSAKTPTDKTAIQRQIEATDRQIDRLVYELYGLTEDEIRIVEEATQR